MEEVALKILSILDSNQTALIAVISMMLYAQHTREKEIIQPLIRRVDELIDALNKRSD
jgi:hypothetical protein